MWITLRRTGRLFNESTGRGQQLVACVWAGRIRPLALGSPAPLPLSLSSSPNAPFIQPSSPLLPPIENEVLCPFHYCPSWSWAWAVGAFWSASTRTRAEPSLAPHSSGYSLPPQTNTTPQSPWAGKGKRKMSKTERDINRMVGQYQWERWTEGKTQRSVAKTEKGDISL